LDGDGRQSIADLLPGDYPWNRSLLGTTDVPVKRFLLEESFVSKGRLRIYEAAVEENLDYTSEPLALQSH
jgi:hypothetical protein